jgi:hypothetical protein
MSLGTIPNDASSLRPMASAVMAGRGAERRPNGWF